MNVNISSAVALLQRSVNFVGFWVNSMQYLPLNLTKRGWNDLKIYPTIPLIVFHNILENKGNWISWRCMVPPPPRKSIFSTIFVHLQVNFTHWRWIQSKYYSFSLELTFYLVSLLFRHQFRSMINETPRKKTSSSNFWNFSKISISHANLAIHTFTCLKWKGPL